MARLEVPLRDRTLWTTGDVLLWAELILLLRTQQQTWKPFIFRVDSGTEMTTMPAFRAKLRDLPFPRQAVPGVALKGQQLRAGYIRAQVLGLDRTEFVFPCYFLGDPDAPPPPRAPFNLLALSGVVDKIRLAFDGKPKLGAPNGILVVEKQ
jgi:hypothetical protein